MVNRLLRELSGALIELHRVAQRLSPAAYQSWALGIVRRTVPFHSAVWALGSTEHGRWQTFHAHAFGRSKRTLQRYHPPGPAYSPPAGRAKTSSPVRAAPSLGHVVVDPLTSLATSITLYRPVDGAAFGISERKFIEALVPHLAENFGFVAIQQLLGTTAAGSTVFSSSGVADAQGYLQVAQEDFQKLLRLEWPQWRDRRLPAELCSLLAVPAAPVFIGRRIAVKASRMSDVFLLQVRHTVPADLLTPRERDVARLLAEGKTYKETARRIGIAPSTVRNHIAAIFAKLEVKKQSEMAAALGVLD